MRRRRRRARSGWDGEEAPRERMRRRELSATRESSGWSGERPAVVRRAWTGRSGVAAEAADGRKREERREWQKAKVVLGMYGRMLVWFGWRKRREWKTSTSSTGPSG
jgi:hypothetical protein